MLKNLPANTMKPWEEMISLSYAVSRTNIGKHCEEQVSKKCFSEMRKTRFEENGNEKGCIFARLAWEESL